MWWNEDRIMINVLLWSISWQSLLPKAIYTRYLNTRSTCNQKYIGYITARSMKSMHCLQKTCLLRPTSSVRGILNLDWQEVNMFSVKMHWINSVNSEEKGYCTGKN